MNWCAGNTSSTEGLLRRDRNVDENVGLLSLRDQHSDNRSSSTPLKPGLFLGEHGWFDKRFMLKIADARTLLLLRYRAVTAGPFSRFSMSIDLAPTFVGLWPSYGSRRHAGPFAQGCSPRGGALFPSWRTRASTTITTNILHWHSVKRHYSVRTADYKLIRYHNDVDRWEL